MGEVVWEGVVESCSLDSHSQATRCYAFHLVEDDKPTFKTVPGIPPINSPEDAVRAAIAAKARSNRIDKNAIS